MKQKKKTKSNIGQFDGLFFLTWESEGAKKKTIYSLNYFIEHATYLNYLKRSNERKRSFFF